MPYKEWYVYLVRCDNDTLYCGIAKNVLKRITEHSSGKGAKYLRGKSPLELVAKVGPFLHNHALRYEAMIKQQRRENKISFINNLPELD